MLRKIKEGYKEDEFCVKLTGAIVDNSAPGATMENGLLFVGQRLLIPRNVEIRELLYGLAHLVILGLTSLMNRLGIRTIGRT